MASNKVIEVVETPVVLSNETLQDTEAATTKRLPYSAFSIGRRRLILATITAAGSMGPLAGNIYLPALPVLREVFDTSETAINATVAAFMIVLAFAPLIWSSFADVGGRRPLYIASLAIFILANVLIAAVPANLAALLVLRIAQAIGSAAVIAMGAGTIADITEPKHRGEVMSYFLLGPQLGPVIGPVLGGAISGESSWRWIFGFLALLGLAIWLIVVFMLPETLRCRVGNGHLYLGRSWLLLPPTVAGQLAPEEHRGPAPPKPTLAGYWKLFSYPSIGIVSFNTAMLYASYFCIAVQLPVTLKSTYAWSSPAIGAAYIAVGIAMIAGSVIGGRANDWRRAKLLESSVDNKVDPESRLFDQIWGVLVCAGGTLMFGWFADKSLHPTSLIIATFLTGFGMSWVFVATTAFLSECAPQQAAGAFALGNMLRNPAAGIAALITPSLVSSMGIGWFFSGFAILNLIVVGGAVVALNSYGPRWRKQRKAEIALKQVKIIPKQSTK